jgi:hypothetical protein
VNQDGSGKESDFFNSLLRITLPLFEIMLRTAVKPSHRIFSVPEGLGVQAAIAQAAISYR